MRKLIIALSILLYVLSVIVIFKALSIPNTIYQYYPEGLKKSDNPSEYEEERPLRKDISNQGAMNNPKVKDTVQRNDVLTGSKEARPGPADEGHQQKTRVLAVFDGESFLPGQVFMNDSVMRTIKELSQKILAAPQYQVSIEGHTDNIPITASPGKQYRDNMDLSYLRAKTVAGILTEQGVAADRISVIGYGDSRPIASNETQEGRARNRRVEVKLVPVNKEP